MAKKKTSKSQTVKKTSKSKVKSKATPKKKNLRKSKPRLTSKQSPRKSSQESKIQVQSSPTTDGLTPEIVISPRSSTIRKHEPLPLRSKLAEPIPSQDDEEAILPVEEEFMPVADDRSAVIEEYDLQLPELEKRKNSLVATSSLPSVALDPVTRYLAEISRYPLLTREQEEEVAKHYFESKDPRLAEVLVTANLRFVVKVAAEYSKFGAKLIDLIQEGNVGLMHAVKEFNPYKGVKLITYAVWWIRGYIQEYLMRQYSMVRIGTTQNQRKLFYQLQKEKQELERLGEEQGLRQISGRLGIPQEEVAEMHQRLSGRDVSLNQPLGQSESTRLLDIQTGDQGSELDEMIELKEHLEWLNEAIAQLRPELSEKETHILEQRLLADTPLTLQEIGDQWGVTREAVRQMEARLLAKLKTRLLKDQGEEKKPINFE